MIYITEIQMVTQDRRSRKGTIMTYSKTNKYLVQAASLLALAFLTSASGVHAETQLGKAVDNKIYAQTLVNEIMEKNSDLLVVGMHVVAPGAKGETMIASNLDRIGKKDDSDDIAVATEHKTILAPDMKGFKKFEVLMPLKEASGKVIGAIGFVFKYGEKANEVKLHVQAATLRDALAKKIPNLAELFKPSNGSQAKRSQ